MKQMIEALAINLELNEPEAWLEGMRRIADWCAKDLAAGLMSDELTAARWRNLASALQKTQDALEEPSKASTSAQPEPAA